MISSTLPKAAPEAVFEAFNRGGETADFGAFLKRLRRRLPPETANLGCWKRLPIRRGRRVTQEEVAEAVGVSRHWYRRLESGEKARASMNLLGRLANTVGFTPEERTTLFLLAMPDIRHGEPAS